MSGLLDARSNAAEAISSTPLKSLPITPICSCIACAHKEASDAACAPSADLQTGESKFRLPVPVFQSERCSLDRPDVFLSQSIESPLDLRRRSFPNLPVSACEGSLIRRNQLLHPFRPGNNKRVGWIMVFVIGRKNLIGHLKFALIAGFIKKPAH